MVCGRLLRWFSRQRNARVKKEDHELPTVDADAALRHNYTQKTASLHQLPADILFMVCQYLTRAEAGILMHTCVRFWHSRVGETGVFAKVWQDISSEAGNDLNKIAARFRILKMLEYDGLLQRGSPSKYCCWLCLRAHEEQAFSDRELKKRVALKSTRDFNPKSGKSRTCLLATRYISIAACCEYSFVEFRHAVATKARINGKIALCHRRKLLFDCETRMLSYAITLDPTANILGSFDVFTKHSRAVDLPLCPHLRLGDQEVTQLYHSLNRLTCANTERRPCSFVLTHQKPIFVPSGTWALSAPRRIQCGWPSLTIHEIRA